MSLPSTFSLFVFCPCTFFAAFCCLAKSCFPMGLNTFSVAETPTDLPGIQFAQILDPYGSRFSDRFRMWIGSETSHFVHRSYMECCNCGEAYHNRSMVFLSFPKVFQMKLLRNVTCKLPYPLCLTIGKCILALSSLMTKPKPKLLSKVYICAIGRDAFTSCVACGLTFSCVRKW